MFPSSYTAQYFRCPKIENARALIQNEIVDSPQLIVIHTGTNDLEMTHTVDDLISEITTMITEASTKFPCSKIIYSTLLPRADVSSPNITHINEQICAQCSKLPNVHLVTHDNVFAKGPDVLHDNKHLRRRHIGLFAANLVEAIRGRTRPARFLNTQTRSPRRQQSETISGNSTSWNICLIQQRSQGLSHRNVPSPTSTIHPTGSTASKPLVWTVT